MSHGRPLIGSIHLLNAPSNAMSLPRRAMEQMGFALCCLSCDAPDVPGSERCRECTNRHVSARERLTVGKATTKAQRLAREQITMLADPGNHILDDDHGKWMERYEALIHDHQYDPKAKRNRATTPLRRLSRKRSIIRDVANQNRWAAKPPDESEINEMRTVLRAGSQEQPMTWDELMSQIEDLMED